MVSKLRDVQQQVLAHNLLQIHTHKYIRVNPTTAALSVLASEHIMIVHCVGPGSDLVLAIFKPISTTGMIIWAYSNSSVAF